MKKSIYGIMMMAALALVGCTNEGYLGNPEDIDGLYAISMGGNTGIISRAPQAGQAAATLLGNNFVVYSYKTDGAGTKQKVHDHYNVNYLDGSAHSTESNLMGWEYVGQDLNIASDLPAGAKQEIKYWDTAAKQYDFLAFSLGNIDKSKQQEATVSYGSTGYPGEPADGKVIVKADNTPEIVAAGAVSDLAKLYIADRVTALPTASVSNDDRSNNKNRLYGFKDAIQFAFRSVTSKVRIGLYETIPGYSVKDVHFYKADDTTEPKATAPTLYSSSIATIPNGKGSITVTFPEEDAAEAAYNKAVVTYSGDKSKDLTLGALTLEAKKEAIEKVDGPYLGRTSADASKTTDIQILPASVGDLRLKVDFTLVSTDITGETINIHGATATVPADYTNWKPNYAYTYIFKLGDKVTNDSGQALYPVYFDATITTDDEGIQQTITTFYGANSITTYSKGTLSDHSDQYTVNNNIYIKVLNQVLTETNAKLYTATSDPTEKITETIVSEAYENDDDGIRPYVYTTGGVTFRINDDDVPHRFVEQIDRKDSPSGDAVDAQGGNFMVFTPTKPGYYVFEFEFIVDEPTGEKYYKVIKVVE